MERPYRKSIRLKKYNYSKNGAYFITICTKNKECILWDVGATCGRPHNDNHLSGYGMIINNEIGKINDIYEKSVAIEKYVIMPNHVHMIIAIKNTDENGRPKVAPTVSRIIQQFKGSISKQIGFSVWQKLFYDHVIRDEEEYEQIWRYIETNPLKWENACWE